MKITLQATGVRIVPASVERPGTGHHHLFVDHDLTWVSDTIPKGAPGIIHLGRGQSEFVLDSLTPGPHRIIAVRGERGSMSTRMARRFRRGTAAHSGRPSRARASRRSGLTLTRAPGGHGDVLPQIDKDGANRGRVGLAKEAPARARDTGRST